MKNILKFSINERVDIKSFSPTLARESVRRDKRFVAWGDDNDFPQYVLDVVNNCATLKSILNASQDYTYGSEMLINLPFGLNEINSENETVLDTIKLCIDDLWVHGGFSYQLKFNALENIIEIMHIPFSLIRLAYI